jgi:hypothetical protein
VVPNSLGVIRFETSVCFPERRWIASLQHRSENIQVRMPAAAHAEDRIAGLQPPVRQYQEHLAVLLAEFVLDFG